MKREWTTKNAYIGSTPDFEYPRLEEVLEQLDTKGWHINAVVHRDKDHVLVIANRDI